MTGFVITQSNRIDKGETLEALDLEELGRPFASMAGSLVNYVIITWHL